MFKHLLNSDKLNTKASLFDTVEDGCVFHTPMGDVKAVCWISERSCTADRVEMDFEVPQDKCLNEWIVYLASWLLTEFASYSTIYCKNSHFFRAGINEDDDFEMDFYFEPDYGEVDENILATLVMTSISKGSHIVLNSWAMQFLSFDYCLPTAEKLIYMIMAWIRTQVYWEITFCDLFFIDMWDNNVTIYAPRSAQGALLTATYHNITDDYLGCIPFIKLVEGKKE